MDTSMFDIGNAMGRKPQKPAQFYYLANIVMWRQPCFSPTQLLIVTAILLLTATLIYISSNTITFSSEQFGTASGGYTRRLTTSTHPVRLFQGLSLIDKHAGSTLNRMRAAVETNPTQSYE
eukprot:5483045-Ditylum_brightwellii.AAC.1